MYSIENTVPEFISSQKKFNAAVWLLLM